MADLGLAGLEFLDRIDRHADIEALMSDFSATMKLYGFNHFMMTRLPAINENAEPHIIAHTWPQEWGDRYRSRNYFGADPISFWSIEQFRPFSWREARDGSQSTAKAQQLASEAKEFGLIDGLGFPMGDPSAMQAVVSLASDQSVNLPASIRGLIFLACQQCELQAVELRGLSKPLDIHLTPREREVLIWTANGKTSWETSCILGISDKTVRAILGNARVKLRAANTTHAVAKALNSRRIHL